MKKITTFSLIIFTSCILFALPPGARFDLKVSIPKIKKAAIRRTPRTTRAGKYRVDSHQILGDKTTRAALKISPKRVQEISTIAARSGASQGHQPVLIGKAGLANLAIQDNGTFLTRTNIGKTTETFEVLQQFSVAYPETGEFKIFSPTGNLEIEKNTLSLQRTYLKLRTASGINPKQDVRVAAFSSDVTQRPAIFDWELPALLVNDVNYETFGIAFSFQGKPYLPILKNIDVIQGDHFYSLQPGTLLAEINSYPVVPQEDPFRKLEIIDLRPRVFNLWYQDFEPLLEADSYNNLFFSPQFTVVSKENPQDVRHLVIALRPLQVLTKGQENYYMNKDAPHIFFKEGDVIDVTHVAEADQVELFPSNLFDSYEIEDPALEELLRD